MRLAGVKLTKKGSAGGNSCAGAGCRRLPACRSVPLARLLTPPPSPPALCPPLPRSTLSGNNLTGTIPAGWAGLPALTKVVLQPGNPGVCTTAPPGAEFKVCSASDKLCLPAEPQPGACPPTAGTVSGAAVDDSGSDDSHLHGIPVAAVAVPVAVVGAAALAAVGFVWYRRRRIGGAVQPSHSKAVYKVRAPGAGAAPAPVPAMRCV